MGKNLKYMLILSALVVSTTYAHAVEKTFSAKKNFTNQTTITWEHFNNVQKACNSVSHKKGYSGFNDKLEACSFWEPNEDGSNSCLIFTKENVSLNTIGHEVRHCFQGNWHK